MRKVPVIVAAAWTLALIAPASPASAARRFHACSKLQTPSGQVTKIRSEYGCGYARKKLRSLLRKGADSIPLARRHSGRWGCALAGQTWTCQKYPRHGTRGARIRFKLEVDEQSGGPPPAAGPVNPLKRCADLWNNDIANRGFFGYHIYAIHQIRRLWVFELPTSKRCAVIGAVPANDPVPSEFGNDGEVSNVTSGWAYMRDVPELGDPVAVQTQATANANATLNADYSITLD
jgi:hypothetical protein